MKVIGLIGGTTYHSTIEYYRLINEGIHHKLGGDNTARIIINSVNFKVLTDYNKANNWIGVEEYIRNMAIDLEKAGADCLLFGANTLHKVAKKVQEKINIPIIHIVEETAKKVHTHDITQVALLGTKTTMTSDFYSEIFNKYGIEVIIPNEADMDLINYSIYEEFSKGIFSSEMKSKYLNIIDQLKENGAEGVILGCTEIPILITANDTNIPLFDTMNIHVKAAIDFALQNYSTNNAK